MRIELNVLNKEEIESKEPQSATWHRRTKSYESDWWDKDIIESTIGHKLDSIYMDRIHLSTRKDIDHMIEFLQQAKESFK